MGLSLPMGRRRLEKHTPWRYSAAKKCIRSWRADYTHALFLQREAASECVRLPASLRPSLSMSVCSENPPLLHLCEIKREKKKHSF